jgi:hypothetical protein
VSLWRASTDALAVSYQHHQYHLPNQLGLLSQAWVLRHTRLLVSGLWQKFSRPCTALCLVAWPALLKYWLGVVGCKCGFVMYCQPAG